MKFGVAGGGRVSAGFVSRLPRLAAELGPVAAQSYRLASRIVNSIGAGHAVRNYADLSGSPLILICAPPAAVPAIVSALAESIVCHRKTILLCEAGLDSSHLATLKGKGSAVGSIERIPGFENRFIAEGDRVAVREAKHLAQQMGGRIEVVNADKMGTYTAGLSFGTSLFTPLMEASVQCFQDAGMSKAIAMKVATAVFQNSVRGYAYTGKRSWRGPLADHDAEAVRREIEALIVSKPLLARYYREAAALAIELLDARRTPVISL